jgi:hypothetical protein
MKQGTGMEWVKKRRNFEVKSAEREVEGVCISWPDSFG